MLMEHIQEEKEEYLIVGEDLNTRTSSEGGLVAEEKNDKRNKSRKSIDKIINKEGRNNRRDRRERIGYTEWKLRRRRGMDIYREEKIFCHRLRDRK